MTKEKMDIIVAGEGVHIAVTTSEKNIGVTVTVIVSSRIDHFTPLMILHSIQSKSTACSNSMNCNCPSIWITFKFQIACCAIHFRKSWL